MIVSDNGPQFTSHEFSDFCKFKDILHLKSPPSYPQCNGQAERFVDTFKRTLNKLQGNGKTKKENLITFLTTYRITSNQNLPQIHFGKPHLSPAEVLLGRPLRTRLDLIKENQKDISNFEVIKKKKIIYQNLRSETGYLSTHLIVNEHGSQELL